MKIRMVTFNERQPWQAVVERTACRGRAWSRTQVRSDIAKSRLIGSVHITNNGSSINSIEERTIESTRS